MVRLDSLLTFPGRITERRTPLNDFEFFLISDKVLMFLARFASDAIPFERFQSNFTAKFRRTSFI